MTVESISAIAIAALTDWLKNLTPVFKPLTTKTNRTLCSRFFPSLEQVTGALLEFLMGSSRSLLLLWLVGVVVFRQSFENHYSWKTESRSAEDPTPGQISWPIRMSSLSILRAPNPTEALFTIGQSSNRGSFGRYFGIPGKTTNNRSSSTPKHLSSSQIYAWPLLQTLLSEVFTKDEWLRAWDNIFSNHPSFLLFVVVAYVIVSRKVLLQCTRKEDFQVRVNYSLLISLSGLFVFL